MYREAVRTFPKDYSETNVRRIVGAIDISRSLTVFAPQGYGKSVLARYLVYNSRFKRKYSKMRNIHMVYVNLTELSAEAFDEITINNIQPENNKQRRFLEILAKSIFNSYTELSQTQLQEKLRPIVENADYKNEFYRIFESFLNNVKYKTVFFVLDGMESIAGKRFEAQREFLSTLREQQIPRIEYIFFMGDLEFLANIHREQWGSLANIIASKILLMKMPETAESILPMHFDQSRFRFNFFTKRTSAFRERLKLIRKITGGYPPYFKYLFKLRSTRELETAVLSRELHSVSQSLYDSLNSEHRELLIQLLSGERISQSSQAAIELIALGILIPHGKEIGMFSAIFEHFIRNEVKKLHQNSQQPQ